MSRKIAVVTEGAGFIGSHMVDRLLQEGHEVRVIDDLSSGRALNLAQHEREPRLHCEWRDILGLDAQDALFQDAHWVFHFAGKGDIVPSIEQPLPYLKTNTLGTALVCQAARAAGVKKLVYAASSSCYGKDAPVPTSETQAIVTEYPYALSKYLGEQTALHWDRVYHLPVNSLRIFNAYGTRSRTSGAYGAVFGVFLKQKLAGQPFTVVGDGTQRRDFVYVTDVVDAFWRATQTNVSGECFNLGQGDPQSIRTLVTLLGGKVQSIPKRPGEPECTWADIRKIQGQLGWQPRVSFQEGVAKMLAEIDYWQDAPLWDAKSIAQATKTWFQCLEKED